VHRGLRRPRPDGGSLDTLATRCAAGLDALYASVLASAGGEPALVYAESVSYIIRLLAILIAAERIPPTRSAADGVRRAADAVIQGLDGASEAAQREYEEACEMVREASGLSVFCSSEQLSFDAEAFAVAVRSLLRPNPDAPIERIFFETMPLSWLGGVYQHLLAFKPDETGDRLRASRSYRKGRGVFFTPPSLVTYIVEGVLTPIVESRAGMFEAGRYEGIRVLDPALGGGDFLCGAIEFLTESAGSGEEGEIRARTAAQCVFGVDVDRGAVEIARFGVWASAGFADGISEALNSHLVCGNALRTGHGTGMLREAVCPEAYLFDWPGAFPEAFAQGGFDAVIGNPPYIAAKNGLGSARASGQSDSYLMFLSEVIDNNLVRPGGLFSMVLPDPMLVRENAAAIRRKLVTDWTIISLLHISEAFPDAFVANVVPICKNAPPAAPTFQASRIEKAADRHGFLARPRQTAIELAHPVRLETILAQDRCEFLYLLERGSFGEIIRRIHGENVALSNYQEPFAPLRKLNVKAIYRGEEVGKSAIISETGDQMILLGGQSIQPYEILWEGRKASASWVRKPITRYHSTKILIQKSSAHIIAALDRVSKRHSGYVFPQSVYAVELTEHGMDPLYLLCILNSRIMNEYIRRTVTGYKLLQPQLEIEDIRALPIRRVSFTTHVSEREADCARGIGIFESESLRMGEFPELANFTVACLTGIPEKSDVIHDVLVHLGREMVVLARANRKSPDADSTRRLEATRAAIETVVWRLYSSEPAQMALPW